ncbi:OTU domain-containing protein 5 [Sarotherodon galilaeus]
MDQHGNPISTYSAVIEWRHGKKQPGGWPHYRGTVVFVCATRFEAARKINALLKENEPTDLTKRVSVHPENYQDDSDDSDPNETQILSQPLQLKKSKAPSKKDPAQEFLAMYSHLPPSVAYGEKSPKKTVVDLKRKIQDHVPELMKAMKMVINLAEPLKRSIHARFIIRWFAAAPSQIYFILLNTSICHSINKGIPVIKSNGILKNKWM